MKRVPTIPRLVLLLAALLCGCTNSVSITSEPAGARVWIDGVEYGRTPLTTDVEWSTFRYNRITLEHAGYQTFTTKLQRGLRCPRFPQAHSVDELLADEDYWTLVGGSMLVLGTYGLGVFAFRGPAKEQHFVLAPLTYGQTADDPAPQDAVIYEDLVTWSLGIGGAQYVSGWDQPTFGAALELRFGNEALHFSYGSGSVECEAIPGGEWDIGERWRYVYRHYMGTASRSREWFLEIGTKEYELEFEETEEPGPSDTSGGTVRHVAAGAGLRYTWLTGSPSCYSEFHVAASTGDELRPPDGTASSDISVSDTQVKLGIIVIGLTF